MGTLVTQMTREELVQLVESAVERKLTELLSFEEVELRPEVRKRLMHQQEMVRQGERGTAFDDVIQELDLG